MRGLYIDSVVCLQVMRHKVVSQVLPMALLAFALVAPGSGIAQTKLYVVNAGEDTVSVIDADTGKITDTIKGPGHLTAIVYNPADGFLYLPTQEAKGRIYIIDPSTNSFVGSPLAVGTLPSYMTISPEVNRGYVSNQFGGLSAVDMTTRRVITEIAAVEASVGSAFAPGQGKVYVINTRSSTVSVVDAASNTLLRTVAIGCFNPLDVKIDPSLHKAFATKGTCPEIAVLDTLSDSVSATVTLAGSPPRRPQYIVIDSAAHLAYVSLTWGTEEKGLTGGVAILNTIDNSIVGELEFGKHTTRLALDASRNLLYVTDRRSNGVFVVDTESHEVLRFIEAGIDPTDIAIVPATGGPSLRSSSGPKSKPVGRDAPSPRN